MEHYNTLWKHEWDIRFHLTLCMYKITQTLNTSIIFTMGLRNLQTNCLQSANISYPFYNLYKHRH
jgi:hypothetical protein